jgi:hypothetical protein
MSIYVTMTDRFMSGWGMAEGLLNRLVFICDTWEEANTVMRNARSRGDMKYVAAHAEAPKYIRKRWRETGPDYRQGRHYIQIKTKDEYPSWYRDNAFTD